MEPELLYLQGLQSAFVPARDLIGIKVDQTPGWRQDVYDALRKFHRPIATFIFGDGFDYPVIAAGVHHCLMDANKTAYHIIGSQGADL